MTRLIEWVLAGVAALCAAAGGVHAAEPPPNPYAAKPMEEIKRTIESGVAELDRSQAARAMRGLVAPKAPRKGEPATPVREPTPVERRLALEAAVAGIGDSSCDVRHQCRKTLTALGAKAMPSLVKALSHGDHRVREAAAMALHDMAKGADKDDPPPLADAVPALKVALRDNHYSVREAAAMACRTFGPVAGPALPELIALLDEKEFSVANAAVYAVAAADPSGERSVPALVKALGSEHDLREFLCVELGNLGQNARAAVPALVELVKVDRNSWHAGKAGCTALIKIVSYRPTDADGNPVQDLTADVRPIALGAIAQSAVEHETHFCRWDRYSALFIDPWLVCPMGEEMRPFLPKAIEDLREFMAIKQTKWWPPRKELSELLTRIGKGIARDQIVSVVEELLEAETTNKGGIPLLKKMLEELKG